MNISVLFSSWTSHLCTNPFFRASANSHELYVLNFFCVFRLKHIFGLERFIYSLENRWFHDVSFQYDSDAYISFNFLALKIELLLKIKEKMYLCVFTKWLGGEWYSPVLVFKLDSKKNPSFEIVNISSRSVSKSCCHCTEVNAKNFPVSGYFVNISFFVVKCQKRYWEVHFNK